MTPYFKTGLANHEFCLCVASEPVIAEQAEQALRQSVPNFDLHLNAGQIEIVSHLDWYLAGGRFDPLRVRQGWLTKLEQALEQEYAGMRFAANIFWLEKQDWDAFAEYEGKLDEVFGKSQIIALCAYSLARCSAADMLDVVRHHQFSLARRHGNWELIETPELKQAKTEIKRLNEELEQRVVERTRELAAANGDLRREIAERKRTEEALRKSEAQLADAQHLAQLGSWNRELETNRVTWSDEIFRIFGMEPRKVGTTYDAFLERVHPDDRTAVRAVIENAFKHRQPFSCEYRIIRTDGAIRIIHERGSVVVNDTGKPIRVFGTAQDITERKEAEEELRKSREQLRALAAYLQSVREEERSRIARELHDEIGQALTGIKLVLERTIRQQSADVQANLTQALGVANELIGRVRDLSLELRPAMLDDLDLLAALTWHFERYTGQMNIKVDFNHTGVEGRRFMREIETAAYRIVQEALTNVARHAGSDKVEVDVEADANRLRIVITDRGRGFDPGSVSFRTTGGLSGMRERATSLGGHLRLDSSPGNGTLLIAELPVQDTFQASGSDPKVKR